MGGCRGCGVILGDGSPICGICESKEQRARIKELEEHLEKIKGITEELFKMYNYPHVRNALKELYHKYLKEASGG